MAIQRTLSSVPALPPIDLVRLSAADRPLIGRLCPRILRQNDPEAAWAVTESNEVVSIGVLGGPVEPPLAEVVDAARYIDLGAIDAPCLRTHGAAILAAMRAHARGIDTRHLDLGPDSSGSSEFLVVAEELGFSRYDSFNLYEAPLERLHAAVGRIMDSINGRIRSRVDATIAPLDATHLDAAGEAIAALIGGSTASTIANLRRQFSERAANDPIEKLQLVAIQEGRIIGLILGKIPEPGVLEIASEAIHPKYRLDPIGIELNARLYETASTMGLSRVRFEAGTRQPNTRRVADKHAAKIIRQRHHLRFAVD